MDMIGTKEVIEILGICDKTLTLMIRQEGFPMAKMGRTYKGDRADIYAWIRSRYPKDYKDMITRANYYERSVRTRGQFQAEEFGIAERPDGTRYTVRGRKYILMSVNGELDGDILVQKLHSGNCSFEQLTREPVLTK